MFLLELVFTMSVSTKVFAKTAPRSPAVAAAQAYLKLKDRKSAVAELTSALAVETKPAVRADLLKELRRTQELFLFDAGQRAFEAGEIGRFSDLPFAATRYEESLKIEGDNAQVLMALALLALRKAECEKASDLAEKILANDPDYSAGRFIQTYSRICSGAGKFAEEDLALLKQFKDFRPSGLGVLAKGYFVLGDHHAAERYARDAIALDPKYPTGYYWLFRAKNQAPGEGLVEAEKFLELCRGIAPDLRRKYQWDAELCRETDGAAKALKVAEGSSK